MTWDAWNKNDSGRSKKLSPSFLSPHSSHAFLTLQVTHSLLTLGGVISALYYIFWLKFWALWQEPRTSYISYHDVMCAMHAFVRKWCVLERGNYTLALKGMWSSDTLGHSFPFLHPSPRTFQPLIKEVTIFITICSNTKCPRLFAGVTLIAKPTEKKQCFLCLWGT